MPKYKCTNKNCENYNMIVTKNTTIKVINDKVVDLGKVCAWCGDDMESIKTDGYTTNMLGSPNICKK